MRSSLLFSLLQYYPKEIDPFLTREQKIAYMVEWWSKAHECLMSENLTAKDFENMSRDAVDKVSKQIQLHCCSQLRL